MGHIYSGINIYIYIPYAPWCWYIDLLVRAHVGIHIQYMEHLGIRNADCSILQCMYVMGSNHMI